MSDEDQDHPRDRTTHFGFETIAEDEKAGRVQGVFDSVARRYDLMNDVMSAASTASGKTR